MGIKHTKWEKNPQIRNGGWESKRQKWEMGDQAQKVGENSKIMWEMGERAINMWDMEDYIPLYPPPLVKTYSLSPWSMLSCMTLVKRSQIVTNELELCILSIFNAGNLVGEASVCHEVFDSPSMHQTIITLTLSPTLSQTEFITKIMSWKHIQVISAIIKQHIFRKPWPYSWYLQPIVQHQFYKIMNSGLPVRAKCSRQCLDMNITHSTM